MSLSAVPPVALGGNADLKAEEKIWNHATTSPTIGNNNSAAASSSSSSPSDSSSSSHSDRISILDLTACARDDEGKESFLHTNPDLTHLRESPHLVRNVWQSNLQEELAKILLIVDDYPFIAMDTEFPGIVARPVGSHKTSNDYQYQTLRTNVDLLKIIQLGLCFCDAQGNLPPSGTCTWQFNFAFSLTSDMYAQDSIDLLSKSGIDFNAHERDGIQTSDFAEWLMTSGIVLNEEVKWISFHSGFDFGYLLKILTCTPLPSKEDDFFSLLQLYFPCVYDIKFLIDSPACSNLHGGLSKIAETLNVARIGPQHQAGSDSLLTAATYFKLRALYFSVAVNPLWSETEENRNAVYREMKMYNTSTHGSTSTTVFTVITNTDNLNEFDTKFMYERYNTIARTHTRVASKRIPMQPADLSDPMLSPPCVQLFLSLPFSFFRGHLAGLNNDWTVEWKKQQLLDRDRRHTKEKALIQGDDVSSDDDDFDPPMADGKAGGSTLSSSGSSPNFVPASSSVQPSHLPMTPQKSPPGNSASHHHSTHSYSPSTHDHYSHNNSSTRLTPNKNGVSMHRNHRYSHDYS